MEDLPHLIDRDLEQITDSIRPENHDVPVVVVHFAGVTERLLDVLALDAVPEGSPLVPHSVTVVAKSLHTRSLAVAPAGACISGPGHPHPGASGAVVGRHSHSVFSGRPHNPSA